MIETPYLTTDGIIELYNEDKFLGIVLIERLNEPHGLALPGGFVDIGESVENALIREMKEETSLDVKISRLQNIYSEPSRDPRFHTVSAVYVCKAEGIPRACDDAKEVFIYKLDEIPLEKLVFDHRKIIEDYIKNNQIK
ncbi:NUDIX hydrolase [Halarcobacter sp.]|uniref:NUDIX hydrolase n=1 Tax=Halarcobacter sp. TaxID=2321133 RepID=UPI002AA8600E|nr:NUDIX hydrolase [Halarcobacter sp.]